MIKSNRTLAILLRICRSPRLPIWRLCANKHLDVALITTLGRVKLFVFGNAHLDKRIAQHNSCLRNVFEFRHSPKRPHFNIEKVSRKLASYLSLDLPASFSKHGSKVLAILASLAIKHERPNVYVIWRKWFHCLFNCLSLPFAQPPRLLRFELTLGGGKTLLKSLELQLETVFVILIGLFNSVSRQVLAAFQSSDDRVTEEPDRQDNEANKTSGNPIDLSGITSGKIHDRGHGDSSNEHQPNSGGMLSKKTPIEECITFRDGFILGGIGGFVVGMLAMYWFLVHCGLIDPIVGHWTGNALIDFSLSETGMKND